LMISDARVVRRDRRGRRRRQRPRVLQVGREAPWRRLRFRAVFKFVNARS